MAGRPTGHLTLDEPSAAIVTKGITVLGAASNWPRHAASFRPEGRLDGLHADVIASLEEQLNAVKKLPSIE